MIMKNDKDIDPFESRRIYQKQKVYQRCLYGSLNKLLGMIRENKKKHMILAPMLIQFTGPNIEADFTETQKEYRQEMYKYLTQKNSQGKDILFMKDVILRNCPKLTVTT